MIYDGDMVSYRNGTTKYRAIMTKIEWGGRTFVLISTASGRKRYNVPESDLRKWENQTPVKAVKTSRGLAKRPRNWKEFMNFSGGARKTYIGDKWVFKKGHGHFGEYRCKLEACRYFIQTGGTYEDAIEKFGAKIVSEAAYYDDVPVAECYLLEDGTLMMERVLPVRSLQAGSGAPTMDVAQRNKLGFDYGGAGWPKWANRVDSGQIGLNRKGELVAYDL